MFRVRVKGLGEKIDLNDKVVESDSWNIFRSEWVNVKLIYDFLMKLDDDVGGAKVFCRLNILLRISEFLLPNKKGSVFSIIFKIVMIWKVLENIIGVH